MWIFVVVGIVIIISYFAGICFLFRKKFIDYFASLQNKTVELKNSLSEYEVCPECNEISYDDQDDMCNNCFYSKRDDYDPKDDINNDFECPSCGELLDGDDDECNNCGELFYDDYDDDEDDEDEWNEFENEMQTMKQESENEIKKIQQQIQQFKSQMNSVVINGNQIISSQSLKSFQYTVCPNCGEPMLGDPEADYVSCDNCDPSLNKGQPTHLFVGKNKYV